MTYSILKTNKGTIINKHFNCSVKNTSLNNISIGKILLAPGSSRTLDLTQKQIDSFSSYLTITVVPDDGLFKPINQTAGKQTEIQSDYGSGFQVEASKTDTTFTAPTSLFLTEAGTITVVDENNVYRVFINKTPGVVLPIKVLKIVSSSQSLKNIVGFGTPTPQGLTPVSSNNSIYDFDGSILLDFDNTALLDAA